MDTPRAHTLFSKYHLPLIPNQKLLGKELIPGLDQGVFLVIKKQKNKKQTKKLKISKMS